MKKFFVLLLVIVFVVLLLFTIFFYSTFWKEKNEFHPTSEVNHTIINNSIENTNHDVIVVALEDNLNEINENKNNLSNFYQGIFELPLSGSTGYASVSLPLYKENPVSATVSSEILTNLVPGQAFQIISEKNDWFYIALSDTTKGWVENKYCLVNLPDVIPSIIYDDTNSYSSLFRSSGYPLEGITGNALYQVYTYNDRLHTNQYIMPLLYPMVKKIAQIQKEALKNDDTLKIYETFRPYEVQMNVSNALTHLINSNEKVKSGITTSPWNKSWFIAVQLSNHQKGIALDVSLAKVKNKTYQTCGEYTYFTISQYEEYTMPTAMHELSRAAATFATPVDSKSKTAWQNAKLSSSMTEGSRKLQNYFTSFGLTPLASEWWHFNDLDTRELTKEKSSNGKYYLKDCFSMVPNNE